MFCDFKTALILDEKFNENGITRALADDLSLLDAAITEAIEFSGAPCSLIGTGISGASGFYLEFEFNKHPLKKHLASLCTEILLLDERIAKAKRYSVQNDDLGQLEKNRQGLIYMTLDNAEKLLCDCLNSGADCYIVDAPDDTKVYFKCGKVWRNHKY